MKGGGGRGWIRNVGTKRSGGEIAEERGYRPGPGALVLIGRHGVKRSAVRGDADRKLELAARDSEDGGRRWWGRGRDEAGDAAAVR